MRRPTRLVRRLGTGDAVVLGLGAMLGSGVFTVLGPAAAAAGPWLLVGLAGAAGVATCNALSSADLAAAHPESGGTYIYARQRLGPAWAYVAGNAFLVGKTASCAAAALVFAAYLAPGHATPVALAAVAAVSALNIAGLRWTAASSRLLVALVVTALVLVVAVVLVRVGFFNEPAAGVGREEVHSAGRPDVLRAGGLLFFAFAGYARVATLGEEVRDPARTIRRAIPAALGIAVALYAAVAVACLLAVGSAELERTSTPVAEAVRAAGAGWLLPVVDVGAAVATLSVLLSVLVAVSRTTLAMARHGDLPPRLAVLSTRAATPWRADVVGAVIVGVLVVLLDPESAVGLSAYCVLLYYALANASALRLRPEERQWPRWTAYLGLIGCLVLAVTLPVAAIVVGSAAIAGTGAIRAAVRRMRGD